MSVAIILVNWNGWSDTIECLESLFRLKHPDFTVVVCDNASSDGSLERIAEWARGERHAGTPNPALAHLVSPAIAKPVRHVSYARAEAEQGGDLTDRCPLVLIQTGGNLGFAGGNNVGIRYALARGVDHVWLLNNDTVVEPGALSALIERASRDETIGIVGSTLRFYGAPERIQALGGATFVPWRGRAHPIGLGSLCEPMQESRHRSIEEQTAYVIGASMLVPRRFLEVIGPMCEDYFLYFEELDWACRASGQFKLAYAPDSHVFHKVGSTAGNESLFSLGFMYRSQLRFMKTFFPHLLIVTRLWLLVAAAKSVVKGRFRKARLCTAVALSPVKPVNW